MKYSMTNISLMAALLLPLLAFSLNAETSSSEPIIAIQGYSPVSYFTRHAAEKGSPEFAVEYNNRTYHLASSEQAEAFRENPDKFIPLFSPFCPYSLTLGRNVSIDPTNFKIVGDQLLLFHKSAELDGLKEWNEQDNDKELIEKARRNYLRYEF